MDRVWGHFLYDPEPEWERVRLEREDTETADEYAEEHRADRLAAGLDEYEVGVA